MKLTKDKLKSIIKEELEEMMVGEADQPLSDFDKRMADWDNQNQQRQQQEHEEYKKRILDLIGPYGHKGSLRTVADHIEKLKPGPELDSIKQSLNDLEEKIKNYK